jgi:Cu/Zn superoxide dismutase
MSKVNSMSKVNQRKMWVTAAAVAAGAVVTTGALAAGPANAAPLQQHPKSVTTHVWLTSMPQGSVTLDRDWFGTVEATVRAFGLTPGSSHAVELVDRDGQEVASFGTLTANGVGQADATLQSWDWAPVGSAHVVILNGTAGDPVSAEPIAKTSHHVGGVATYQLIPVEVGADGANYGTPRGAATITYNRHAQTITVTVNASGLTPGAHAAHIHVGSCAAQGPVQYMLMDFTADANGQIVDQTRTVANVTTPLPDSGWYLNLHQGNSNNILTAAGTPTINFRPLLCGNIVH